ncbi:hypothetical protein [Vreelandella populi]|uniref:hypothetical protein n=1 Tax=Vreelandella populi TaxID=2498858 RepID=UPI000F8F2F83|nr:hypothetical protein [Halomonas populi]RUR56583.1 hypothetical protein ELY40_03025 [Halomonas populi]
MVSTFKLVLLLFTFFVSFSTFAENVGCNELLERVYGDYSVEGVERYRGGLTSKEKALSQLNTHVSIKEDEFMFWNGVIYEDPIYKIEAYEALGEEGSVPDPSERYGNFYGYGQERERIRIINVRSQETTSPSYMFEVVGDELWFFLDGWFYRLKKISSDNSVTSFSHSADSILDNNIRG